MPVVSTDASLAQPTAGAPQVVSHYGDPFGEQRRLEAGDGTRVGTWAREAVRIANRILGPDDVAADGETIKFLHLDGSDNVLPNPGDIVATTKGPAGRVTSVANHHELGPIALAALSANLVNKNLIILTEENGQVYQIAASVAS